MDNDERDPQRPPEPPATPDDAAGEHQPTIDEPGVTPDVPSSDIESWPSEPEARSEWPDETASSSAQEWSSGVPASADVEAWPTEPPAAGSGDIDTWPTEPPAGGSGDEDAWPTRPPEPGDQPYLAAPAEAVDEPPPALAPDEPGPMATPSEVEAYPAIADDGLAESATETAHAVPAAAAQAGESTQCPRCGQENQPGLSFCRNCGQRLVAAGVATTVERPAASEGTMACPRCGTHNRTGVAFCQNCGANLRGTSEGYVPPAMAGEPGTAAAATTTGGAVLGPVVLLIGIVGLVTGYLLPFAFGSTSLFDRAFGAGGYGIGFWSAYPDAGLPEQVYFGLAAAVPVLVVLLATLAIAGFVRGRPGMLQSIGLWVALLWSVGLAALFVIVELAGNWSGDIVGMLRDLSPGGIIFFLASLIALIGTLTRFGRS